MPAPPDFRLTVLAAAGRTVVSAAGELDLATAPDFAATVLEQLQGGPVVLDLHELSFMDSTGVRMLDALLHESDTRGWRFVVRPDLHRSVRQVLELTGMMAALPLEDQEDEGI